MTRAELDRVRAAEFKQKADAIAAAERASAVAAAERGEFDAGGDLDAGHVCEPASLVRLEPAATNAGDSVQPIVLPSASPPPAGTVVPLKSKEQIAREEKTAAVYKQPVHVAGHTKRDCIHFEETPLKKKETNCHDCGRDIPAVEDKDPARASARCIICFTVYCYDCIVARLKDEGKPLPTEEQPFLRRLPPAPLAPPRRVYPFQLHLPGFFCASGGLS